MDMITVQNLKKYFGEGPRQVKAVDGIDLSMEKGELTAVIGASGSGKTTLLNLIGGLYQPTEGTVTVDGVDLGTLREEELTVFRRRRVGFVFQDCSLVPELTVRENILLPLALDGSRPDAAFFEELTCLLGIQKKLDCFPHMLSGGGQQCAAIARALITRPAVILADEPTGSFDVKTSQNVAGLLKMTVDVFHQTLVMITHNLELAQLSDRVVRLRDGRVVQ
ncbi:MAG: ABC transporter ATP-binding protein [Oscillibacter sp.]|jgi:putative ABC transport system ATP-binding protein|nr:ABC transporter ATP-binding protein [uncultured Oscillibacter sp.]MCI8812445.1 ABC transporter ATP-binding protein [Oscillibacter sp.]